jgi:hypothetical protein
MAANIYLMGLVTPRENPCQQLNPVCPSRQKSEFCSLAVDIPQLYTDLVVRISDREILSRKKSYQGIQLTIPLYLIPKCKVNGAFPPRFIYSLLAESLGKVLPLCMKSVLKCARFGIFE